MAGIVRRHERAVQRELTLRQAGEALVAVVDRQGVYQAALDAACSLVPDSARTWIAIMEGGSAPMTIVEARGAEGIAVPPPDLSEEISVLAAGQPVEIQKYAGQLDPQRGNMLEWVFVIPLLVQQSLQGAIVVAAAQALPEEAQDGFRALASQLSLALERAVLEEERRRSEARFRSLVQNAADITALIDHSGTIRFVSPSVERILGYDPDAFVGVYIAAVIHPDDRARVGQFLVAILDERGATPTMEARLRHQDGSWRDVEWIGNNLLDDPNVGGIVVNVRDITDRKRAEERVRLLASIVESSDDAIVSKMLDGRIVSWNAGAERLYGYTAAEIIGHSFAMLVPPERSADVQWILDRITRGERIEQWETERQRKDGTRVFIALTDSPIRDGRGHIVGLSSIGRDITERKKVDRLKNEFISTVSHELRTPLTSIRGSLGLVVGGVAGELPPQAKTMVEIAYTNSERLVRLINDILDIEKIESGNMVFSFKVLDLMTIVDQAVKANGGFAEQFGVTFEITAAAPGVRVMADGDRLMQVLTNLLSNAAKFSPPNASVDIAIHRLPHGVRVQVHDRGPGIPDEFRGRIFQKFAQADASTTRKKGGTGLGLSIVKAIVEKHGGHVGFEMPPDGGTIFYVDLQEWSEPMPQLAQVEEASRPWVLICEDDSDVATLLRIILEQGGFSCDVAYGAIQAKALLAERQYTAMTLDIRLPDQDGISLIRELRNAEETRCLPIVVVSVVAQPPEEALNGAAVGLIDWLCKPIDPDRLVAAVRQTVRQGSTEASRILHVEDDKDVREVVRMLLQTVGTVVGAGTLAEARQKLSTDSFDLILLDVELPDGSGLDLLPPPASDRQVSIPVLIFSAQEVNGAVTERVAAALVKTRTSNQQLLATIAALIGNGHGLSM
jgi:PAS domain S-box-containing protein